MKTTSKVISIVTSKGGVGKTTVCLGLAGHFAKTKRVLLIDLDYQCNLSNTWRFHRQKGSVYDVLTGAMKFKPTYIMANIDLLYGSGNMSRFAIAMQGNSYAAFALRDLCETLDYDVIIVDSPVSDLESRNAIQASDLLLSVVEPEEYSFENVDPFMKSLKKEKAELDGIIINKIHRSYKVHKELESKFRSTYGDLVYKSVIPTDSNIMKAQREHQVLIDYSPNSKSDRSFGKLKNEIWEQLKK